MGFQMKRADGHQKCHHFSDFDQEVSSPLDTGASKKEKCFKLVSKLPTMKQKFYNKKIPFLIHLSTMSSVQDSLPNPTVPVPETKQL